MSKIEYIRNGKRKDKLVVESGHGKLKVYEDSLGGHLIINVEDWASMSVDRGNGDEEDIEYGQAAIMLKRDGVAALIHRLQTYMDETFYCVREGRHPICQEQCTTCKMGD